MLSFLKTNENALKTFLILIVIINLIIFFNVNIKPIAWRHNEITHFNFLWSTSLDQNNLPTLHTGIHKDDLQKTFMLGDLENHLRFRHFANFVEMVTFKFWQNFKITTFHNYSLIVLHLLNTVLIGILIRRLTQSNLPAIICSLFFLNSGIALSTLLFPSRIPKILIVSLFLLAWLTGGKTKDSTQGFFQIATFNFILLLMLFTDETAFLLIPLLYLFFYLDKNKSLMSLKSLYAFLFMTAIYFLLRSLFVNITEHAGYKGNNLFISQATGMLKYFTNTGFITDTLRAFFGHFLRRHFGYWDHSFWGALSFIVSTIAVIFLFIRNQKSSWLPFCILISFIFIKAILCPHPYGVHASIMGPQTVFPTVLFFNYYYPYIDSTIFLIALGLLLKNFSYEKTKVYVFSLLAVVIINISNAVHSNEGIQDALNQHSYYQTGFRNIKKIVDIEKLVPLTKEGPIYLSFPSGSKPFFTRHLSSESDGWGRDPLAEQQHLLIDFIDYGSIILPQYLKLIEEKKFIVSLKNIESMSTFQKDQEILNARYFYDVHRNIFFDLDQIKKQQLFSGPLTILNTGKPIELKVDVHSLKNDPTVIFFIKGAADIFLHAGNVNLQEHQNYGFSYQMFSIPVNSFKCEAPMYILITIRPSPNTPSISLWGPFAETEYLKNPN